LERMLSDLGYASYSEALVARSHSPREVIRSFLLGMSRWSDGGAEQVLETLDLSYLPPHMRAIEGPILADYLRQVIDRVGYIIWQEVPDDPNMVVPYTFYRHPLGSIRIERMPGDPEEPPRWAFSSATLEAVPDLFAAIQDMPLVEGVGTPEPVTEFFQLREEIREFSPVLLERGVLLENWQWGALLLAVIASLVAGWLAAVLLAGFLALFWRDRDDASREAAYIQLAWPLRIAVASTGLLILLANLGLLHSGLGYGASIVSLIAVIGLTFLVFRLIGLIGGFFIHRAEETPGYVDEIVSSLATGLLKLVTVILGIFGAADVVGLPYEGVITGLGIGGIALAFAARDTVSNMLGGAILMADRPFKRGDLIATEGELATIENVGLRSTRLRTLDDSLLVIPNAQLSDKAIVNWGQRRRRKVLLQIGLTYDTPRESLDKFVERLKEVYRDQPRADLSTYYVGLKGFGPSSIDIELWGYFGVLGYEPYVEALHQLMGDIVELAKEVGVSFAFPTRTIHVASDAPGLMPEIAAAGEGPAGASKAPANIA